MKLISQKCLYYNPINVFKLSAQSMTIVKREFRILLNALHQIIIVFNGSLNCSIIIFSTEVRQMMQNNCKKSLRSTKTIIKSAIQLEQSQPSVASFTTCTTLIPPQPLLTSRQGPPLPFSVRFNMANIPPQSQSQLIPSCPQREEIKVVNVKRISEAVRQIKKGVLLYRYLEKDEAKCKQTLSYWFQEVQASFLNALNYQPNRQTAESLLQEEIGRKTVHLTVPCCQNISNGVTNSSKSISEKVNNVEIEDLRQQVESYKRDFLKASQKLDSIFKMFGSMKERYDTAKKEKKVLEQAMVAYVEDSDQLIQQIIGKYKKEGIITLFEQQVRQVLTKLKFMAFNTTAI